MTHCLSRLDSLPNELLERIMRFSDGVITLYAFVNANCQAKAVFELYAQTIILEAVKNSGMERQLQKIFCTVLSFRHRRKYHGIDTFQSYVNNLIGDRSTTVILDLNSLPPWASMNVLIDACGIYDSISSAATSFIETQMSKMTGWMQTTIADKEQAPSSTELHRIHRALWRLRLYYEAYYEPYISKAALERKSDQIPRFKIVLGNDKGRMSELELISPGCRSNHLKSQSEFFLQMTAWELEEMECLWYHLRHENEILWHRRCCCCQLLQLPDDLLMHLRRCGLYDRFNVVDDVCNCNFAKACRWFRVDLEIGLGRKFTDSGVASWGDPRFDPADWPDPLAQGPNEGYQYLVNHHWQINPNLWLGASIQRGSLKDYLEWGYCIWDADRLKALGSLDDAD